LYADEGKNPRPGKRLTRQLLFFPFPRSFFLCFLLTFPLREIPISFVCGPQLLKDVCPLDWNPIPRQASLFYLFQPFFPLLLSSCSGGDPSCFFLFGSLPSWRLLFFSWPFFFFRFAPAHANWLTYSTDQMHHWAIGWRLPWITPTPGRRESLLDRFPFWTTLFLSTVPPPPCDPHRCQIAMSELQSS